jgi:glutathione-regulated potassium-efflux system ancillary protein KefC
MTSVWALAALWLGLAVVATLLSIWMRISTALSEIAVGTIAQLILGLAFGPAVLGTDEPWVKFLAGIGAIVLTFLAGAELDPQVFKLKWKEAAAVGLASFSLPFLGCAAAAHYWLGWEVVPSWLAGVAMSTMSVAVVYAVMLEFAFNVTDYGKTILAACFITDLGTVVALGLIFAPFTAKTAIFLVAVMAAVVIVPWAVPRLFKRYGGRPSEFETKFLLLCLLGMGALATWAGSEAVLPAYLIGIVLAGTVGRDHALVRRLRTLTFGLLAPFYFIRAGSLSQYPHLSPRRPPVLSMVGSAIALLAWFVKGQASGTADSTAFSVAIAHAPHAIEKQREALRQGQTGSVLTKNRESVLFQIYRRVQAGGGWAFGMQRPVDANSRLDYCAIDRARGGSRSLATP